MAVLTSEQRRELNADFMRKLSSAAKREPLTLLKAELEDTFSIVDDEIESVVETLRTKITSKAQAALDDAMYLQIVGFVVQARQQHAETVKEAEVKDGKR